MNDVITTTKEECKEKVKEKCKEKVFVGNWGRQSQCSRNACKDGFCKQHHPETKKAREEEKDRRWEEKQKKSAWYLLKEANEKIARLEAEIKELRSSNNALQMPS